MSFTGDLEHLPIVDVIQLLHSTRKSGTLCVRGRKGESQLVFMDGYIVSANHPNNSIRVGRLLAESGAITQAALEQALAQQQAVPRRRPLIAILLESGALEKEAAYRGLTALIEITIVEMLRNVRGTFCLDVERFEVSDEFRYFPEHLQQELSVNTQLVLMDALRLFDERARDGLAEQPFFADEPDAAEADPAAAEEAPALSADDLGLGDLDQLGRQVPEVFTPIEEIDPAWRHREALAEILTAFPAAGLECLVEFLTALPSRPAVGRPAVPGWLLVCYSQDQLLRHGVTTLCQAEGIAVFTTSDEADLGPMLTQFQTRGEQPLLLLDAPAATPGDGVETSTDLLRWLRQDHGHLPLLQLVHPEDYVLALLALRQGARLVLPRPPLRGDNPQLGPQLVATLEMLGAALGSFELGQTHSPLRRWLDFNSTLRGCCEPAEISFALLQAVAEHCPRALTLVIAKGELIVERGIGFGPRVLQRQRLALNGSGKFQQIIERGSCHFGPTAETLLPPALTTLLGAPAESSCLLLPLQTRGKTVALIYADFDQGRATAVPLELLQALALQAGLTLDNALYRKQLERPA